MNSEEKNQESGEMPERSERPSWRRKCCWIAPMILIAIAIKGALVMLLWNELIPQLFQGPSLNYLQAIGLMVLVKLLVGFGFGGGKFGGHGHGRFRGGPFRGGPGGWGHRGGHCGHRGKFWARMSPEERDQLREELRKKWDK